MANTIFGIPALATPSPATQGPPLSSVITNNTVTMASVKTVLQNIEVKNVGLSEKKRKAIAVITVLGPKLRETQEQVKEFEKQIGVAQKELKNIEDDIESNEE